MELITENVEEGSHIVTDEWRGYSRSTEREYTHHTVNHSRNYVDPESGYHTQNVERAWVDCKCYMKKSRGGGPHLQAHLDEFAWRKMRKNSPDGLLNAFLSDVKAVFDVEQ